MTAEKKVAVKKAVVESYDISSPDETLQLARELAHFIKENNLSQNIQGKEYVNVEGWQYAGSRLGILPVADDLQMLPTEQGEYKYQAKVRLLNVRTGEIVGGGFAICSNREQGKKYFQEFAIASMAQTRAIGKAYRNALAWIIRAAGYEPTPAEEMNFEGSNEEVPLRQVMQEEERIVLATAAQKEEIIKLLNNKVITMDEKNKMLLNINRLSEERATEAIAKLKKTIEERKSQSAAA